jgi:hypothetical protein
MADQVELVFNFLLYSPGPKNSANIRFLFCSSYRFWLNVYSGVRLCVIL